MSTTSQDLIAKAEQVFSTLLGTNDTKIGVGDRGDYGIIAPVTSEDSTNTSIKFTMALDPFNQEGSKEQVLKALRQIPGIENLVQTEKVESIAAKTLAQLKTASEGTGFKQKLLEWTGFNPEIAKSNQVYDHAVMLEYFPTPYKTEFSIHIPHDKNADPVLAKDLVEKVEANIKERLPEIKAALTEETLKYTSQNLKKEGKSDAEIAEQIEQARAKMDKLETSLVAEHSRISIRIQSPEQIKEEQNSKSSSWEKPANSDALESSNPLNELTRNITEKERKENPDAAPQLEKALAKAFLFASGEKAMEIFPLIAGSNDMHRAIEKEAKNFPEKSALFAEALNSDLFKKHQAGMSAAGAALEEPRFNQNIKDNKMEMTLNLTQDNARKLVEAIANYQVPEQAAQQQPTTTQAAATPQPQTTKKEQPSVVTGVVNEVLDFFGAGKQNLSPAAR